MKARSHLKHFLNRDLAHFQGRTGSFREGKSYMNTCRFQVVNYGLLLSISVGCFRGELRFFVGSSPHFLKTKLKPGHAQSVKSITTGDLYVYNYYIYLCSIY